MARKLVLQENQAVELACLLTRERLRKSGLANLNQDSGDPDVEFLKTPVRAVVSKKAGRSAGASTQGAKKPSGA